jgi:hypothetical protein
MIREVNGPDIGKQTNKHEQSVDYQKLTPTSNAWGHNIVTWLRVIFVWRPRSFGVFPRKNSPRNHDQYGPSIIRTKQLISCKFLSAMPSQRTNTFLIQYQTPATRNHTQARTPKCFDLNTDHTFPNLRSAEAHFQSCRLNLSHTCIRRLSLGATSCIQSNARKVLLRVTHGNSN